MQAVKLVVVGDEGVGKTCLLITQTTGKFSESITTFDNYENYITVDGRKFNVGLWDTAGNEEYDRLRPLSYPRTDVFILCYSINSATSLANITTKWFPEVVHHCPNVPILLLANKVDLRSDPATLHYMEEAGATLITYQAGLDTARSLGIAEFKECSSLTKEGLQDAVESAIRLVVNGGVGSVTKYKKQSKKVKKSCFMQ